MTTWIFNKCSPCTSHPGLTSFHYRMFHGLLRRPNRHRTKSACEKSPVRASPASGVQQLKRCGSVRALPPWVAAHQVGSKQYLLRNVYAEPDLTIPDSIIMLAENVFEKVQTWLRCPVVDIRQLTYVYPFKLGVVPREVEGRFSVLDDVIFGIAKAHRTARTCRGYVPIRPKRMATLRRVAAVAELTRTAPYSGTRETAHVLADEDLLDAEGIVATGFGYQVSRRVRRALEPSLIQPYFRIVTYRF